MDNWERKLNQVNSPDSTVQSHRDGLRNRLKTAPAASRSRKKISLITLSLILVVGFSGLTIAYPGWAEDVYQYVIVRKITLHTEDGGEIRIRSIETDCEPGDSICGSLAGAPINDPDFKMMVFDKNDPRARTMTIDAEISDWVTHEKGAKMVTIQSLDCGSSWIVNGDTLEVEEMTVAINGMNGMEDLLDALSDEEPERTIASTDEATGIVTGFELRQNYPNPFNPSTQIAFDLDEASSVSLKVYDLTGREIRTLVNENKSAGSYTVTFDAAGLPSGTYLYTLRAGEYQESKKMVLMK